MTEKDKPRVLLGHIGAAHGLKGELRVQTYTANPEDIASYGTLTSEDGARQFTISTLRPLKGGAVIVTLKGVSDRTAAEALRGEKLYVSREHLPEPDDGEYYHADLIGLAAFDAHGHPLGEVIAVQNFGAGDLLEIRLGTSRKTVFAQFTREHTPAIDVRNRRLTVIIPAVEDETSDIAQSSATTEER